MIERDKTLERDNVIGGGIKDEADRGYKNEEHRGYREINMTTERDWL